MKAVSHFLIADFHTRFLRKAVRNTAILQRRHRSVAEVSMGRIVSHVLEVSRTHVMVKALASMALMGTGPVNVKQRLQVSVATSAQTPKSTEKTVTKTAAVFMECVTTGRAVQECVGEDLVWKDFQGNFVTKRPLSAIQTEPSCTAIFMPYVSMSKDKPRVFVSLDMKETVTPALNPTPAFCLREAAVTPMLCVHTMQER